VPGDARSKHGDLAEPVLRDSAVPAYGEIVPMVECRDPSQLSAFVHDLTAG
jgi:hypothetical protein